MAIFEITGSSWGYYIQRNGKTIKGPYNNKAYVNGLLSDLQVADRAKGNSTGKEKFRPCITCSTEFLSEGAHNRMCDRCRREASDVYDGAA